MTYFNHQLHTAVSSWERREFINKWRQITAGDKRWTPPYFPRLRQALNPARNPHLARLDPLFLYLEAMKRPSGNTRYPTAAQFTSIWETPLVAGVITQDPRRQDGTAHLSLFHCANSRSGLEAFLEGLAEKLPPRGVWRLIGPTGLSPHLGSGVLQDYWHEPPPLHTAYNGPYLPDLLSDHFRPIETRQLYHLPVPPAPGLRPSPHNTPATLTLLQPQDLPALSALFAAACSNTVGLPPPDALEIAFLLDWLGPGLLGWLALVEETPVGFVLLQPDFSRRLRQAQGGRSWLRRLWFMLVRERPVRRGRLLFAGVVPAWQNQGIGRQLLRRALDTARQQGWEMVTVGPLDPTVQAAAVSLLQQHEAQPRQTYRLYEWTL